MMTFKHLPWNSYKSESRIPGDIKPATALELEVRKLLRTILFSSFSKMNSTKMIIYFMLTVFLAQTLVPGASADDDEYFQKAIFRVLKEKNGQFDSSLNMTRIRYGHRSSEISKGDLEEKFCFKTNTGWYGKYMLYYDGGFEQYLYINETELYNYNDARRRCRSYKLDEREKRYQFR